MLLTTTELVTRAMRADLVYTMQRMQVIANREGNPFGIAIRVFGAATALAAARLPSSRFNRFVGLNPAETESLQDVLAWYDELGPSPQIEITPGDLNKSLADALARAGFRQTSFHASLVGEVAETPPTDIVVRSVETPEMMERFLEVYLAGWELPLAIHDRAVEDVHRGEQRRRAVALIVVRHGSGATLLQRQSGLCAVKRLNLAHMGTCGSRISDQVLIVTFSGRRFVSKV